MISVGASHLMNHKYGLYLLLHLIKIMSDDVRTMPKYGDFALNN